MKKIIIAAAAAVLFIFFASSCSRPVKISGNSFTEIKEAEPAKLYLISMLKDKPYMILWDKGAIMYQDCLLESVKWNKLMDFLPEGFDIHKKEASGVRLIPAKYMEGVVFSSDGKYAAFTMKLGPSLNGSIAVADIKANKVIFTETVEDRPPFPQVQNSIAIRDTFYGPVFSDDSQYLAYARYDYLNARNIRIRNLKTGNIEEIANALMPMITNGTVYYITYEKNKAGFSLVRKKLGGGKPEILEKLTEGVACLREIRNKVIMVTENAVYRLDAAGVPGKLFSFDELKTGVDAFEINDAEVSSDGKKDYVFVIAKKKIKENYFWRIYGREIQ
jgi:hypothetical protein